MIDKLRAAWIRLPVPAQKFIVDSIEGAVAAVVVLNLALPRSTSEATAQGLIVLAAIASAVLAAARRELLPAIVASWLRFKAA